MNKTIRSADAIRSEIAEATRDLSTTRNKLTDKSDQIQAIRDDLRRQVKPHLASNRLPASIRTGQERLGVLVSDSDLLSDYADELEATISKLQKELNDALRLERIAQARLRAEGLRSCHHELSSALDELQCQINATLEYKIKPLVTRLADHKAENVVQSLGCATVTDAWAQHPEFLGAILSAFHAFRSVTIDAKPLQDAVREAEFVIESSQNWLTHYMPMSIRTRPTIVPVDNTKPAWKPDTVEEAKKLGLWMQVNGKDVILSHEQKAGLMKLQAEQRAAEYRSVGGLR